MSADEPQHPSMGRWGTYTPLDLPAPGPVWHQEWVAPVFDGPLPDQTEVLVVGAGIAGLTTAALLARSGRRVVVVEADRIGAGVTGHTTAKVQTVHGLRYHRLTGERGPKAAATYARAQQHALNWILTEALASGAPVGLERRTMSPKVVSDKRWSCVMTICAR